MLGIKIIFFFWLYWGMNSGSAKQALCHLSHSITLYVLDIFEIWSRELFAQAGFEP
jgi:hypothetical protein